MGTMMPSESRKPLSFKYLYYLLILTMPIGLGGIGLPTIGNIAVGDFVLPILFVLLCLSGRVTSHYQGTPAVLLRGFSWIAALFLLIPILSIWNVFRFPDGFSTAVFAVVKLMICVLYAFVTLLYLMDCTKQEWNRFVLASALSGLVFALSCILGVALLYAGKKTVFVTTYSVVGSFRANGFQVDPNLSAIFLMMSLAYVFLWAGFSRHKWVPYASAMIIFIGMLLTTSKAIVITLCITAGVILLFTLLSGRRTLFVRMCLCVAIVAAVLAVLATQTTLLHSLVSRLNSLVGGDASEALTGRDGIWEDAFAILFRSPLNLIFGIGGGMFYEAKLYYGMGGTADTNSYVHNTFLSFALEYGMLYAVLVAVLLIAGFLYLLKRFFKTKDSVAVCALWGYLSILIFMNSVSFQNNRMAYVFLTFVVVTLLRSGRGELSEQLSVDASPNRTK